MWSISADRNKYLNNPGFYLLFSFFLFAAISVNGQKAIPELHQNVNLPAEELRLDYLLRLINKQTGIKFSLNTQKFKPSRIIHIRKGIQSIGEILSEIKNSTGVYFTYLGDHVIFTDTPPVNSAVTADKEKIAASSPSQRLPPSALSQQAQTSPSSSTSPSFSPSSSFSSLSVLPHLAAIPQVEKYLPEGSIHNDKIYQAMGAPSFSPLTCSFPTPPPPVSSQNRTDKKTTNVYGQFFVDAGLTADETMYLNPTIRVGCPFIYGIAQFSTNFIVSGFRYGVGGSFRVADKWRLGLNATTGNYSKGYQWNIILPGLPVSIDPITVNTSLQKIGLSVETAISRDIQIQFGPMLNILGTKYYTFDTPIPIGADETNANKFYNYIKPPYTIQDNYSPYSTQNTKLWIGLQASLFYRINFLKIQ